MTVPDFDETRLELARVLASDEFRKAERRSRLLKFLVERALDGNGSHVKEYVLGLEVFEKPPDYDPRIDPVVRIEMGRVRKGLAKYYDGPGRHNRVRIEFPKGRYAPLFLEVERTKEPGHRSFLSGRHQLLTLTLVLVSALGLGIWYLTKHNAGTGTAAELCVKARAFWNKRTPEALRTGLALYQQAVRQAPRYAPAYAGQALSYAVMATNSELPAAEFSRHAVDAANEAMALDPNSAEAHAALGLVAWAVDSDWETAERELTTAVKLDPTFATAHQWRALSLLYVGQAQEASNELERALAIDPSSMPLRAADGMVSYYAREYDKTIEKARKMLESDPSFREAHLMLGMALEAKHDFAAAEREFQTVALASDGDGEGPARLARLYALTGATEKSEKILGELLTTRPDRYVDPYQITFIYTGMGRKTEALDWLTKAVRQRTAATIKVDPVVDPLRSEPAFGRLLAELHLN
ncbi:MAG TPA: hypothetical protein VNZ26_09485 [Vicinamibacterales bacterium]|nr:hypothetical protein [Vicinamibacterales bacterium]